MLAHLGHGGRLVYNLPATDAIYQRFVGINGSAYFVGGLGMTAVAFDNIVVVSDNPHALVRIMAIATLRTMNGAINSMRKL
jgi:hypothetical protein